MILNGKCKEKFLEWISLNNLFTIEDREKYFNSLSKLFQNALIIEFFDSLGIYINATLDETNKHKFKYLITDINTRHLHCWKEGVNKDSREQARKEGVITANDIYNERFK